MDTERNETEVSTGELERHIVRLALERGRRGISEWQIERLTNHVRRALEGRAP